MSYGSDRIGGSYFEAIILTTVANACEMGNAFLQGPEAHVTPACMDGSCLDMTPAPCDAITGICRENAPANSANEDLYNASMTYRAMPRCIAVPDPAAQHSPAADAFSLP